MTARSTPTCRRGQTRLRGEGDLADLRNLLRPRLVWRTHRRWERLPRHGLLLLTDDPKARARKRKRRRGKEKCRAARVILAISRRFRCGRAASAGTGRTRLHHVGRPRGALRSAPWIALQQDPEPDRIAQGHAAAYVFVTNSTALRGSQSDRQYSHLTGAGVQPVRRFHARTVLGCCSSRGTTRLIGKWHSAAIRRVRTGRPCPVGRVLTRCSYRTAGNLYRRYVTDVVTDLRSSSWRSARAASRSS